MIRVLLIEDETIVREGVRQLLEARDDILVVGELECGERVLEAVRSSEPDVVLLDLAMPDFDGIQTLEVLSGLPHAPAVIVLTTFDTDQNIVQAMQLGAVGFLRKTTSTPALVSAIRAAAAGESVLSPTAVTALLGTSPRSTAPPEASSALASLTNRERTIVQAVAEGRSNSEIAAALFLSEATVKSYISRLLVKLDVSNRVQLARLWWQGGAPRDRPDAPR